jgi:alpha-mannosidase
MIEEEPAGVKSSGKGFSYKIGHYAIETFKIEVKR